MPMQKTHKLDVAKKMPPLYHRLPEKEFNHADSEVLKWLVTQPDIAQHVFDKVSEWGYIVYDNDTGKWRGVDYNV